MFFINLILYAIGENHELVSLKCSKHIMPTTQNNSEINVTVDVPKCLLQQTHRQEDLQKRLI